MILLLLSIPFSVNAPKLDLRIKDAASKTVLKEITTQTGYNFLYSDALKRVEKKIFSAYRFILRTISTIINKIFSETDIIYILGCFT